MERREENIGAGQTGEESRAEKRGEKSTVENSRGEHRVDESREKSIAEREERTEDHGEEE